MPQGLRARKRERRPRQAVKNGHNQRRLANRGRLQPAEVRPDPVPDFLAQRGGAVIGRIMTSNGHFAGLAEVDRIDAFEPPFADIGGKFRLGIVRTRDKLRVIAYRSILTLVLFTKQYIRTGPR